MARYGWQVSQRTRHVASSAFSGAVSASVTTAIVDDLKDRMSTLLSHRMDLTRRPSYGASVALESPVNYVGGRATAAAGAVLTVRPRDRAAMERRRRSPRRSTCRRCAPPDRRSGARYARAAPR